jgi:pyruvate kinase
MRWKRTKIICTIGPASAKPAVLEKMVRAGMNVARLNFSHGTHAEHKKLIATIRVVSKKTGQPITILQDLQGPKVRVGELPKEGVMLAAGESVVFTTGPKKGKQIPVGYGGLHRDVRRGDRILLDDGLLEVEVTKVSGRLITTRVLVGGLLTSHKGFNVPTASLSVDALPKKDIEDLRFGLEMGVDIVAMSFVRTPQEVLHLRRLITAAQKKSRGDKTPILIVAKIEKHEALKNLDAIIEVVDGIMVARGDLAVETPAAEVPLWQKTIVKKCLAAAKPVIVATQMMDSMIRNPRPTRAEISDVANAIIDHTDAVMLSGESATGKYPVEAVRTMATVAIETEASCFDDLHVHVRAGEVLAPEVAIGKTAGMLAHATDAKAIVACSITGHTARQLSRFRPEIPIFIGTPNARVLRQMNLSWGLLPFLTPRARTAEVLKKNILRHLVAVHVLHSGDRIIYVSGIPGKRGETNQVTVETV